MKAISADLTYYEIASTSAFQAAWGGVSTRKGILIEVSGEDGSIGLGESAPLPGYSPDSLEDVGDVLQKCLETLKGTTIPVDSRELPGIIESFSKSGIDVHNYPSAVFGLETAIADLAAKAGRLRLCKWLDSNAVESIPVNGLLSESSDLSVEIERFAKLGIGTLKVKVGSSTAESDIERVVKIRNLIGSDTLIRLDANRSWDYATALRVLSHVKNLGISFVEEPLKLSDIDRIEELNAETGVYFGADESLADPDLSSRMLESDSVTALIVKPGMIGGISEAMKLFKRAAELDKSVAVTSMLELGVGVAACAQLAAAYGVEILPCGLDTLRFFSDSLIQEEFAVIDGHLRIPESTGIGVALKHTAWMSG